MKTVTLEVKNDKDLELLYMLTERLGIHVVDEARSEEDLAKARAIIEAGTNITKDELKAFLEWHEADRADRPLPFRD
ncbi:MAG: hypothetical protein SFU99_22125 [Saprospiraceae bacterium]|nr:hypothetical protein [Saprospiraceae bacterium]